MTIVCDMDFYEQKWFFTTTLNSMVLLIQANQTVVTYRRFLSFSGLYDSVNSYLGRRGQQALQLQV